VRGIEQGGVLMEY